MKVLLQNPYLKSLIELFDEKYGSYKNYNELKEIFLRVVKRIIQYYSKIRYNSYNKKYFQKVIKEINNEDVIYSEILNFINNYFPGFIVEDKIIKNKLDIFLKKKFPLLNMVRDNLSSIKLDAEVKDGKLIISLHSLCNSLKINSKILKKYFILNPNIKSKFLTTDNKLSIIIDFRLEFHLVSEIEDISLIEKLIRE